MENEIKDSPSASEDSVGSKTLHLKKVLDQNEEIKENVKESADQLNSVNVVLKNYDKAVSSFPTIEDVIAQNVDVIAQNVEAEKKVAKAAEDLEQVNTQLIQQVAERTDIESELMQTKQELSEVRTDLSKSQAKEKDAVHMALHDPLTELPNRLSLEERLSQGLAQAKRHGWKLAIMFIDLDKFKDINDSYGHDIGDQVLVTVANRLQAFIRSEDMVSRWGGDEFICILSNINLESDVINLAKKMATRISEDCDFDGTIVSLSATIGIVICPRDGDTADILFKKVDRAMYRAKGTDQSVMMFNESILDVPPVE